MAPAYREKKKLVGIILLPLIFVHVRKLKFFSRGELYCCLGAVGGPAREQDLWI